MRFSNIIPKIIPKLKQLGTKLTRSYIEVDPSLYTPLTDMLRLLIPNAVVGYSKVRIGTTRDGSYIMLDDLGGISKALSFGINNDVCWDLILANKGIKIYQYDYTVDAPPVSHPNFEFHKTKIGAVVEPIIPTTNIASILTHISGSDIVLKMDIEGSEWEVLSQIDPSLLQRFKQILIEVHCFTDFKDPTWLTTAKLALDNLTKYHQVIHTHGNNNGLDYRIGIIEFPGTWELTLVRKADYEFVPDTETYPTGLDKKNTLLFPDSPLEFLRQLN